MKPPGIRVEAWVAEPLGAAWTPWFAEMGLAIQALPQGGTRITGSLPDQAAVYGLIGRLRDLNLTLLEIRRSDE